MTQAVTAGATYLFQVQAKNKWGWGALSSSGSILAATVPATMGTATTEIDAATGGVKISWAAPTETGGLAISAYLVEILGSGPAWASDTACPGTGAALADLSCIIPMANLAASPHSLAFDSLVEVRISATNAQGTGSAGPTNTAGARIRQAAAQMTTPTEGPATSDSQIEVLWTAVTAAGTATGNSAILRYELYWDNGEPSRVSGTDFLLLVSAL